MLHCVLQAPEGILCHSFLRRCGYLLALVKQFNCACNYKNHIDTFCKRKKSHRGNTFGIQDNVSFEEGNLTVPACESKKCEIA